MVVPQQSLKIGLILGSVREVSNTAGVSNWLIKTIRSQFPSLDICSVNLGTSPGHPLPFVLESAIPEGISIASLPNAYSHPDVRAWSAYVSSLDGVILLTPQYNWGYPAALKNALDHLFHEWVNKPVAIMTIGGRGGTKAAEGLKIVCKGGLDMQVVESSVNIALPKELIRGPGVVNGQEEFLAAYEAKVKESVEELIKFIGQAKEPKAA